MSAQSQTAVRVLVVDDDDAYRTALCATVTVTPGFAVVGATSSGDGLDVVVSLARPQLVLLDVNVPGVESMEIGRRLRRHNPDVVVVLLTASGDDASPAIEDKLGVSPRWLVDLWRRHDQSGRGTGDP